jgi:hypothetical protein
MKFQTIIAAPLMFLSNLAWCAWDAVYETKTAVHYIDPTTLQTNGQLRRVLTLQDLKQRGKHGELSMQALMEYDCTKKSVRPISATAYPRQMAAGEIISRISKPAAWIHIAPESAFSTTLRYVCAQ